MKANLKNARDGINESHRKDALYQSIKAIDPKTGATIVDARIYWPGSVCYACLWVRGKKGWCTGSGKAGGYGYHKPSAALGEAIDSAGIELSEHISGRGDSAMREAVEAIAKAVSGKRKVFIVEAFA